jgi:hypothetical protein
VTSSSAAAPHGGLLSRGGAFAFQAAIVVTLLAASSTPTPIYPSYLSRWHLSDVDLSLAFSGYPVGLLAALLVGGSISDHLGRRPVIIGALAAEAMALLLIFFAVGAPGLVVGRVLQGVATGVALGAVGAYLVELASPARPRLPSLVNSAGAVIGTAVGAIVGGVAVAVIPSQPQDAFLLLVLVLAVELVGVALSPETWRGGPGLAASLVPHVHVPRSVRARAFWTLPGLFLAWAVSSVTLSFAPVLIGELAPGSSALLGGAIVIVMCIPGGVTTFLVSGRSAATIMIVTLVSLVPGAALMAIGVVTVSLPAYFAGTAIAGVGIGTSLLGGLRMLTPAAPPERRAAVISAVYVAAYCGLVLPSFVIGGAAAAAGLAPVYIVFAVSLGVLSIVTVTGVVATERRRPLPDPIAPLKETP